MRRRRRRKKKGRSLEFSYAVLAANYTQSETSKEDEVLFHVKNLGGRFSLSLFVDDVDNEPPVLLESCNISLSISSAGARGE